LLVGLAESEARGIVLGSGKRLFGPASEPLTLFLHEVMTVGEGILIMTYRSAGSGVEEHAA